MVKGEGLKGASRARKIGGRGHKVGRFALNVPEVQGSRVAMRAPLGAQ